MAIKTTLPGFANSIILEEICNYFIIMDIKVVIFEDNSGLREMLFQIINFAQGLACTGAYPNALDLDHKMKISQPDIVLMDIDMPGISGIEAVRIIKEKYPNVKILMQTIFENNDKVFESLCAGASGYLLKNNLGEKIIEAIKELNAGGAPMSPPIAKKILSRFQEQNSIHTNDDDQLSLREKEILDLLTKGLSYKMIAAKVFLSVDTIKFHIKNIYEKLHVHTKSEAIMKALHGRMI